MDCLYVDAELSKEKEEEEDAQPRQLHHRLLPHLQPPPTSAPSLFKLSTSATTLHQRLRVYVNGPIIVGAGPSGLATAACLQLLHLPFLLLEKESCIACLWRERTYDRLKLHLPKAFCSLPFMPFPAHFPDYPTRDQFLAYLDAYCRHFHLRPRFGQCVESATFDPATGLWHVSIMGAEFEYLCRWVVVATGENAVPHLPELPGREAFKGNVVHSICYKNGEGLRGKEVLVVGCGNSGMEVCLDLCEHGAKPFMVVRSGVHVLPRDMFGVSTFRAAMALSKWLPLKMVDMILVFLAERMFGGTQKYGLRRPEIGPLELKSKTGKTPVLDVGAMPMIKSRNIKIMAEIDTLTTNGAKFVDGKELEFHSVILARGYKSNFSSWLKDCNSFSENGKIQTIPCNWKRQNGLYFMGFAGKGLQGIKLNAERTAENIRRQWSNLPENKHFMVQVWIDHSTKA